MTSFNSDAELQFFDIAPIALYRSKPSGELISANPALAALLGFATVAELLGNSASVDKFYANPVDRSKWQESLETGTGHDFDIELIRQDGSRLWVRDTARVVRDEDGTVAYYDGSLIDVSDKVLANRAKDQFIATVSHELRNPIAVIVGLSQELDEHYDSFTDEDRREMANLIARQGDDASWLIEDLLVAYRDDLSGLIIDSKSFDVLNEIKRVLEVTEPEFEIQPAAATTVIADPRRTRQILRNLVTNVVRYGGEKRRITLTTLGDRLEIRVEDSGKEIAGADIERMFRPFERGPGTPHHRSVGLGLSVARRLARLMDGDLTYRHVSGWSTFVLSLPVA